MNTTTTHVTAIRSAFALEIWSEHKSEQTASKACTRLTVKGHPAAVYSRSEAEEIKAEFAAEIDALDAIL